MSCVPLSDSIVFHDPENIGIDIRIVYLEALITKLYDTLLTLAAVLKKRPHAKVLRIRSFYPRYSDS